MRGGYIKYALIGLAPYSFHYDLSQSYGTNGRLFAYYIAFNDVHNFWLPKEKIPAIFRENFLLHRLPAKVDDLNNVYGEKSSVAKFLNYEKRIGTIKTKNSKKATYFPATFEENIKILDEYLNLCESRNVRPIMFLPPMTKGLKKYYDKQRLDEFYYWIYQAQKNHSSAVFFDGWKLDFPDKDFYDDQHLNIQGAAKFSTILNNVIENLEKG